MKKYIIFWLFLLVNLFNVNGKQVEGNSIIIGEDTISVVFVNLDTFFINRGVKLNELYQMYPVGNNAIYVLQWKLQNDSLFLNDINFIIPQIKADSLKYKFFEDSRRTIFFDQFTDTIVGKYGRLIRLPYYSGIYEKERSFYINKGKLIWDSTYYNVEYNVGEIQRINTVETCNEIAHYLETNIDWKILVKSKLTMIRGAFMVNNNGEIKNIIFNDGNKDLCSNVQALLSQLPNFQILKYRGKPIQELYQFMFDFNYKHRKVSGSLILQKWWNL